MSTFDLIKRQINDDVFTNPDEARARSMDLGLGGSIHVHEQDGQTVYMPGASHESYLMAARETIEEVDETVTEDMLERAIAANISAVTKSDQENTVSKMRAGQRVSWSSSGGTARGVIRSIHRSGTVPNIPVKITATEDAPAARIELLDDEGKPRGEFVGHKLSTLNITKAEYQGRQVTLNKPFRMPSGSSKKFGVFVRDGDRIKRVTFGDPNMTIRRDNPEARRNFRARHSCDTATDKTSARYWSCRMWEAGTTVSEVTKVDPESVLDTDSNNPLLDSQKCANMHSDMTDANIKKTFEVIKADAEQRIVWGWASVSTENGELVTDSQGDIIETNEMVKMANDFMLDVRLAKAMHQGEGVGEFIHSFPVTKELADALGIETTREGWVVGMKVHDDDTWEAVKRGEFSGFSIGGRAGKREPVE